MCSWQKGQRMVSTERLRRRETILPDVNLTTQGVQEAGGNLSKGGHFSRNHPSIRTRTDSRRDVGCEESRKNAAHDIPPRDGGYGGNRRKRSPQAIVQQVV